MIIEETKKVPSKGPIKHTLRMRTVPEHHEKLDFGELPPLPPHPNADKPNKSFFQRILKK